MEHTELSETSRWEEGSVLGEFSWGSGQPLNFHGKTTQFYVNFDVDTLQWFRHQDSWYLWGLKPSFEVIALRKPVSPATQPGYLTPSHDSGLLLDTTKNLAASTLIELYRSSRGTPDDVHGHLFLRDLQLRWETAKLVGGEKQR